jgi:Ser/Thr protein kinase RdoA (MazF antagonist)
VDDAAGGRRGTRATVSAELPRFLRAHWGVRPAGTEPDLGGSSNLNLLVTDDRSLQVARVYRPFVTGQRVAALQAVRRHLASHGIPCAEPIPARGGRGWELFQGRAVEVEPYVATLAAMNTLPRVPADARRLLGQQRPVPQPAGRPGHDFDFLGERPRTDDLALTLYHTSADITSDPAQLTEYVAAYETGLGTRLSQSERAAIPLAMARQPLWSIAVWVALLDSQATARRHLAATAPELTWALQLTGRIAQVQDALTHRLE